MHPLLLDPAAVAHRPVLAQRAPLPTEPQGGREKPGERLHVRRSHVERKATRATRRPQSGESKDLSWQESCIGGELPCQNVGLARLAPDSFSALPLEPDHLSTTITPSVSTCPKTCVPLSLSRRASSSAELLSPTALRCRSSSSHCPAPRPRTSSPPTRRRSRRRPTRLRSRTPREARAGSSSQPAAA